MATRFLVQADEQLMEQEVSEPQLCPAIRRTQPQNLTQPRTPAAVNQALQMLMPRQRQLR